MNQTDKSQDVTCPLCQHNFNTVEENCHSGCPVASHCHAVKCPNCGYEFVEHSSVVSFFSNIFRKNSKS